MNDGLDGGQEQRAARYARTHEWLAVADLVLRSCLMLLALATGSSASLRSLARGLSPRFSPGIYTAAGTVLSSLIALPFTFYGGFIVERRYELSNQSPSGWLLDWVKGVGLGAVLAAPLVQGASWVMGRWKRAWWAVLSAMLLPITIVAAQLAPVAILPIFNKFERVENEDLEERVKRMAAKQGVAVSQVLCMNMSKQTKKANAFFTGIGRTKRIVLGDTLLRDFDPSEVDVVVAHELGHQVHGDIWKLIALQVPLTLGSFLTMHLAVPRILNRWGGSWGLSVDDGLRDPAALPLVGLIATVFSVAMGPLTNAWVRRAVEYRADAFSLELTNNPSAFVTAMQRLGRMNFSDPDPPRLVKWLFHDHPTLRERIQLAEKFAVEHEAR